MEMVCMANMYEQQAFCHYYDPEHVSYAILLYHHRVLNLDLWSF